METIQNEITIQAPREKVWDVLWGESTYGQWTAPFAEGSTGSTAVTDWKEGSKVLFLGGNDEGMVAVVTANKANEKMSFKHLGMVKNGVEDTESDEVKKWAPAMENYTLSEENGGTKLRVELETSDEWKDIMKEKWPLALDAIKKLAEA